MTSAAPHQTSTEIGVGQCNRRRGVVDARELRDDEQRCGARNSRERQRHRLSVRPCRECRMRAVAGHGAQDDDPLHQRNGDSEECGSGHPTHIDSRQIASEAGSCPHDRAARRRLSPSSTEQRPTRSRSPPSEVGRAVVASRRRRPASEVRWRRATLPGPRHWRRLRRAPGAPRRECRRVPRRAAATSGARATRRARRRARTTRCSPHETGGAGRRPGPSPRRRKES